MQGVVEIMGVVGAAAEKVAAEPVVEATVEEKEARAETVVRTVMVVSTEETGVAMVAGGNSCCEIGDTTRAPSPLLRLLQIGSSRCLLRWCRHEPSH